MMIGSLGGTHFLARWILAVLALNGQAPATSFWLLLLADAADETLALGEVVPLVAGIHACPTAAALVEVDDHHIITVDLFHSL
jgi:hypothetical protein